MLDACAARGFVAARLLCVDAHPIETGRLIDNKLLARPNRRAHEQLKHVLGLAQGFLICPRDAAQRAVASAVRLMKEGGAHAVKIEADASMAEWVRALVRTGIPVVAHVGFTPQSEHALGGFRVQGRGDASERVREDAVALAEAGAFCVLMEMVTAQTAQLVDEAVGAVPTIGIGASNVTTGQVLVWQDMMGVRSGRVPRFVKQFAQVGQVMEDAARAYREQVRSGEFPAAEHTFE